MDELFNRVIFRPRDGGSHSRRVEGDGGKKYRALLVQLSQPSAFYAFDLPEHFSATLDSRRSRISKVFLAKEAPG
jgi:hypothetical protein